MSFPCPMTPPQMTAEEIELDREWRARFGQPLPMLGCAHLVRRILTSVDATPARAA